MSASSNRDAKALDRIAYDDSLVHRLDPRAKVVATVVFVVAVASHGKYELSGLMPFVLFPVFFSFYLSFHKWNMFASSSTPVTWPARWRTALTMSVPPPTPITSTSLGSCRTM